MHFKIAELLVQAELLHEDDMPVLATHWVGITHELKPAGSQQPTAAYCVFLAQTKFVLAHVMDDSVSCSYQLRLMMSKRNNAYLIAQI